MFSRIAFAMLLVLSLSASAQTVGNIYTFAGSGAQGATNGAASTASFFYPGPITFDPLGNLYVADENNYLIRKITPAGVVSTFAGTLGVFGNSGNAIGYVDALASDSLGNIYFTEDDAVRVISAPGVISTFANGFGDATALAFDSYNNLYVGTDNYIKKVTPSGVVSIVAGNGSVENCTTVSGPVLSTPLSVNHGSLAVNQTGTDIYFSDYDCHRVLKINAGNISVYAGTGTSGFSGEGNPATAAEISQVFQMALDSNENLYIADELNNQRIREISYATGRIITIAGTGNTGYNHDNIPATTANLSGALGVALDSSGNIYISDSLSERIREVYEAIDPCKVAGNICTVAGNPSNLTAGFAGDGGPALGASLNNPLGLFVNPSNNIFVADSYNNRVREFTVGGPIQTIAGNGNGGNAVWDDGDGGAALSATTNTPGAITEDGSGNLAILDEFSNGNTFPWADSDTYSNIRIVSLSTGLITSLINDCYFWQQYSICRNNFGGFATDILSATNTNPSNGIVGPGYFVPVYPFTSVGFVSSLSSQSGTNTQIGWGLSSNTSFNTISAWPPVSVAADQSGNLYVAGSMSGSYTGGGSPPATPFSGTTYTVARVALANDTPTTIAGSGNPTYSPSDEGGPAVNAGMTPGALAVDLVGNIFIVDLSVSTVRVIPAGSQNIYTIAGDPTQSPGFSGDGGPATSAQLNHPGGIKVDSAGNLYISDTSNNLIRMVANTQAIISALGQTTCQPNTICGGPSPIFGGGNP